jgi:hypothetical protein
MPAIIGVDDLNCADLWTEQRNGRVQVCGRLAELHVLDKGATDELYLRSGLWGLRVHDVGGHVVQQCLCGVGIHSGHHEFRLAESGQAHRVGPWWVNPVAFDELNRPPEVVDQLPHVSLVVGLGGLWVVASPTHISSPTVVLAGACTMAPTVGPDAA